MKLSSFLILLPPRKEKTKQKRNMRHQRPSHLLCLNAFFLMPHKQHNHTQSRTETVYVHTLSCAHYTASTCLQMMNYR